MKNIKFICIVLTILVNFHLGAQEVTDSGKLIKFVFQTVEKKTNAPLFGSVIEVVSNGKRIGLRETDYKGTASITICSKKITDGKITVNIFGMRCRFFTKEYVVSSDSMFKIYLEDGETKYQTIDDKRYIWQQLNIPVCAIEMVIPEGNEMDYQHCDGRIKKKNEIPENELYEWELIVK